MLEIKCTLTQDELTMLEWILSEFRANCRLLHPAVNRDKCAKILNNLADKFNIFDAIQYQEALQLSNLEDKDSMILFNQLPPADLIWGTEEYLARLKEEEE